MHCPRCQQDNADGANFCNACGSRLGVDCPRCHRPNPAGSRFCNDCGAPLPFTLARRFAAPDAYTPRHLAGRILTSRAALEGERKQVTILFADVKGSLELIASHDAEDAREVLDPVLERMMDAVHQYEGTVNQVMGDGIMALFGAPLAHEDHALRACYAALSMQEAIGRHAAEVRRRGGREPRIRVGLNSGEVVVRSIGNDLHMDYSAVGESTHLAARMEQLAEPGHILLTAHTLRLAEGQVEAKLVGAVPVKGIADPVVVYELRAATAARSRLEAAAPRGLTPFVGRDAEMATLFAALDAAASGRGQVMAIVGEPGVGKSRLVWELSRSGQLRDWLLLEGHAMPYGKGSPYLAILELLRSYFQIGAGDTAQTRARVAAALGATEAPRFLDPVLALLGQPVEDVRWTELSPDQKRRRTLDAVKHVLARAAPARPVCVIVEDLHWADPETLAVLDSVVEGVAAARIALIVTYRPEHQHEWGNKSYYGQVRVDSFSPSAAGPLLDALIGTAPELEPLKRLVAERTDGNPFFLEETVRHLAETGALAGERGAYRLLQLPAVAQVPETVHAVIASRIDRLRPEDKRVLQEAAAIGKDFSRELLMAIADRGPDDLVQSLQRLQARELIYETRLFPDVAYTFRHALTHEVGYGGLLRDRRRALDARIVGELEVRQGNEVDHVDHLAHHAMRGELWDKAVMYCRQAGARALSRFANRAGATYFEQALTALGHRPPDEAVSELGIDLRLELRSALLPLGQYRRILELLTEAKRLADAIGDRRRAGGIASFLCNYFTLRFDFPRAVEHGAAALDIARATGDRTLAVVTNSVLAAAYYGWGDYRRSVAVGTEAMAEAEGISRERFGMVLPPLVYAGTLVAWSLAELGDFVGGQHVAKSAMGAAEALAHPHSTIFASLALGMVHLRRGAAADAIAVLERALHTWETADLPAVLVEIAGPLASAYCAAGRADEAIALLERAVAQALALRHRWGNLLRSGGMAEAYLAAGRVEETLPLAQLYVELARMVDGRGHVGWALRLLADVAARRDPTDAVAESSIDACLAIARELGMRPLEARALATRGRIMDGLGRSAEAEHALGDAARRFTELGMTR